ncbi:MAG TPA: hypothetical protein VMK53_02280 [Gemmatimonadales bacterium]|nr:hypothetical protein [Gemmatimonadales bacterium]
MPPASTLEQVFVLESWGVPAEDTTVTFNAMEPRVILVRRGEPDNSVFAELRIGPGAITPPGGAVTTTVTLVPLPGMFGLEVVLEPGAQMTGQLDLMFSYAVHFVMPDAARQRYGTAIAFERDLFAAQLGAAQEVRFLPSRRPASDLLATTITAPGTYILAAPR